MFSTLITVALFVSLAIPGTLAGFAINNPKLLECVSAQVSWAPGTPPYTLQVVDANNPCEDEPFETFQDLTTTTYQYKSDLKAGTAVLLFIADSAGNEAWSGEITIGGNSSACAPVPPTTSPSIAPTPLTPSPSSSPAPGLGGAINAGSSSSGMLTVHRASTPLLFTILAALLALTL